MMNPVPPMLQRDDREEAYRPRAAHEDGFAGDVTCPADGVKPDCERFSERRPSHGEGIR